jgi:hypothetical protein
VKSAVSASGYALSNIQTTAIRQQGWSLLENRERLGFPCFVYTE